MMGKVEEDVCRFAHFSMSTTFEILIAGRDNDYARKVSQDVFAEVDRIERLFNHFDPCSEIGQINGLQPGQSLRIGVETYECLKTAVWVRSQTHGAFDINIGSLSAYKGETVPDYTGSRLNIMDRLELSRISQGFMVKVWPVEEETETHILSFDLGGIGKGYALDRTLDILSDWDIHRAMVHGGTSTALAIGAPPKSPTGTMGWPVGIGGDWNCPQAPREFLLRDRALSGSGTEVKGKHILDPRSGRPAQGHLAAWVSHPSAAVADALSTAFMVMSTEEARDFCESHPDVWALVVIDSQTCEVFNPDIAIP
ncbi:MAG: FAD:protein FMN transferase [Candidatus Aminicenantes bacterium]|nr:FAD:protein FMN transferase [Candidatus Aminicenantes bacterium]MDH5742093.1 FAD:protein FMN transferase [Candidatus Aminicenantes bacterium]